MHTEQPVRQQPQTEFTDHQLVTRAQAGDHKAFTTLWQRHTKKIRSILSRFARQPADTEDLTQETLLRAFTGLASFRGDAQFYTWLYTIAFNTGVNFYKSQRRQELVGVAVPDQIDTNGPETNAITGERRRKFNQSISCLPHAMQQALLLNTVKGYGYAMIGQILECPTGTVRSRISRARSSIAATIDL